MGIFLTQNKWHLCSYLLLVSTKYSMRGNESPSRKISSINPSTEFSTNWDLTLMTRYVFNKVRKKTRQSKAISPSQENCRNRRMCLHFSNTRPKPRRPRTHNLHRYFNQHPSQRRPLKLRIIISLPLRRPQDFSILTHNRDSTRSLAL